MRVFREVRSVPTGRLGIGSGLADAGGTFAAAGPELAGCVGSRCAVPPGLGALLELLFAGLQARTVQERVPSRKVLRLTSKPIPRYSRLIARHLSVVPQLANEFATSTPRCRQPQQLHSLPNSD
jgi:hypothetical protein